MRFHFLLFLLLAGCGHQKVSQHQKETTQQQMLDSAGQYENELEIADFYANVSAKEQKHLSRTLSDLIMGRGEAYRANYEWTLLDPYRAYPFLKVNADLDDKIKILKRRLKLFADDMLFKADLERLIARLEGLKKLIVLHPQYRKECKRCSKYCFIESAADLASHEIEDLKERALAEE